MKEVYIYDSIRTPRGKGRKDGALHEVSALRLSVTAIDAIASRNGLEGHAIEDVIWGNVTQVGEQGACCLLYTSPSPRDLSTSRMPSSA